MNLSLKIAILKSGQPQWGVAQAAGLGPVRLSMLVRGHAVPRPDEAARLSAALDVPQEQLFPEIHEAVTA